MRLVDRAFGVLLILAGLGHAFGSVAAYRLGSSELVWALCATVLAVLLGSLNLLRTARPDDRALAWITFCGSAVWVVLAIAFGASVGNVLDPRALTHAVVAFVLAGFSLRIAMSAFDADRVASA